MKKVLALAVLLLALAAGVAVVNFYVIHPKLRAAPALDAPDDPETIERGRYLAHHILGCVQCHSPIDEHVPGDFYLEGRLLAGREFPEMPDMIPGRLVAPNLTPDAPGLARGPMARSRAPYAKASAGTGDRCSQ